MKLSPAWRRALTLALVAAAAFYLYRSVAGNWEEMRAFRWDVDPWTLAASVAAHVGVLASGVWVWGRVLDRFEHPPVRLGTLMRIWFLSNLARYIPGKIFQFVAAAQLAAAAGLSGPVLLTSLVVHTGFSLLAATLLSAWTLAGPLFPALSPALPLALGTAAAAAAVFCVHPRVLNAALGLVPRLLKKRVIRWNGTWGDGLLLLGCSLATWALYGAAYWLLIAALADVPARAIPVLAGINTFSFVAGYLVFVTPGGLGVREAVMTSLLIPLVGGPGVAAVLAIASRLWTVLAELAGGALVLAATRGARSTPVAAESAETMEAVELPPPVP